MKKWKRWIAGLLMACMLLSLVPPVQRTKAATVDADYYYELDTDGIDAGAQYLIVSGTGASEKALYMNPNAWWNASDTTVSVVDGSIILPFDGESNCQWTFSNSHNGTVYCSGYYLNIEQYARYQSGAATMQFASFGNGRYGIYLHGGSTTNLQYLRYGRQNVLSSSKWYTAYKYGSVGTNESAYESFVYLYKRVENQGVSVTFDSNGATAGTVPEAVTGLDKGTVYTVPAPSDELRMDAGNDTYLFRSWNTRPDGTGTEYVPGSTVILNEDLTLYAGWYLQTKYQVTVITDLDDAPTDIEKITGEDVTLYIRSDAEGSQLIPLERTAEGHYSAWVTENGTYYVYAAHGTDEAIPTHGHKVVVFNQGGTTELLNYSVSYDANGGSWTGEAPASANYHANTRVTATDLVPVREGYLFRGWQDQNGTVIPSGGVVTEALLQKTTLTAVWEALIDFTVTVVMEHGENDADERHQVTLQLMQESGGVNLPYGEAVTLDSGYIYNEETNTTTYTYIFKDLPQGTYHAITAKSHYIVERTHGEDHSAVLTLTFNPETFDLAFDVKVNGQRELLPVAVNVKLAWLNDGVWQIIARQSGSKVPYSVLIDANGQGSAFYPVLKNDPDTGLPRQYRLVVTSFVMPDGTVLPATGDGTVYTPDGSGLYTATVWVENGGDGAYFENGQIGTPKVTVDVTPFTVTFDAGEGTLEGEKTLVLTNQYAYPDLAGYIPQSPDEHHRFVGWYMDGQKAENLAGSYLTENVTYEARFSLHAEVSGEVFIGGTYEQDGETVTIKDVDRVTSVLVILEKNINGVYNDVDSQIVPIEYTVDEKGDYGKGTYQFTHLPNDGTQYAVRVAVHNYSTVYNNDGDTVGSEEERNVILDDAGAGVVDVYMLMTPELYSQWAEVDTTRISESFRPTEVKVSYLHRDMEGYRPYAVIAQHVNGGLTLTVDEKGIASGFESVWKGNITGAVSEYQLRVDAIVDEQTVPYDENAPFTVDYGTSSWWSETSGTEHTRLTATLIPREYEIIFDMNCGSDPVQGMELYLLDGGSSDDKYGFVHTWSEAASFSAFPYRQGYEFAGWTVENEGVEVKNHGDVYIAPAVAEPLTLTANWTRLSGTDYTVRFLELNTDKVLKGALTVTGSTLGQQISSTDVALEHGIPGYVYAGSLIHDTYYDKTEDGKLLVSGEPTTNLITLYYVPEGGHSPGQDKVTLEKNAVLEEDGSYSIQLDLHAKNPPVITLLERNTPLDIALVLDQSGSIVQSGYLDELQQAVNNFVNLIADHGRSHEVDHRIAVVGYAGDYDEPPTSTDTSQYPIAGGNTTNWVNTGTFDSNGDFHPYPVTGFDYTPYEGEMIPGEGIYYTYADGEYLLLTYHAEYRHLITEQEAKLAVLNGQTVYGYVYDDAGQGSFVELTRNTSGLWLYGDKQLYSLTEFFTYHQDVWTHRTGLERRQIHAYGTGDSYQPTDGHEGVYTRTETTAANPELSIYKDALVPVSVGANGSGGVNPGLTKSVSHLASNGGTYVQYGIEMANRVFAANPLDEDEGRVRIMILFTDGMPGIGTFDETVANEAIAEAYISKNTYGAHTYAIGLYPSSVVSSSSDQAFFMNGVSSNYPTAQSLDDVRLDAYYTQAADGTALNVGGPYYVLRNGTYYELDWTVRWVQTSFWQGRYVYSWNYKVGSQTYDVTETQNAVVSGGKVGDYTIYRKVSDSYKPTDNSGYYSTTDSEENLKDYFELVMHEITTRITTKLRLREDTVLRDILGGGLVLEPGATITAYKVKGVYSEASDSTLWDEAAREQIAQVVIPENGENPLYSPETTTIRYENAEGEEVVKENVPYITVHNLDAANPDDPDAPDYRPHSVDVTGYDFEEWYVGSEENDQYKLMVEIRGTKATSSVEFGRATYTNGPDSGLWSPEDEDGERELLIPFERPTTIFVERAYVLDYGKEFTLTGWYFDDEGEKNADALHLDCNVEDGMNSFDPAAPNTENAVGSAYGNTRYGNVRIEDGAVTYTPVTTQWGGSDSFYIFGSTWRKTVLAQDANENGNLWNKVTVIPANNIYFEDSFITAEGGSANGITGFTFTGDWETVYSDEASGSNREDPEHQEGLPYGDVHGWTNDLADDALYSDGSAHTTRTPGATAEFTFTGTGVDVYTRTNAASGMVVAVLYKDGTAVRSIAMDNLAMSGDYYQIPTVSFAGLSHDTYTVRLIATVTDTDDIMRYEYHIDGIRIYDPLGNDTAYQDEHIRDAYGKELNAVFTEVRDVLLDSGSFTSDLDTSGAVFIDWLREGQTEGNDQVGTAKPTYQLGTFAAYGPKNEVYLSSGQALVMKVADAYNYFVGLKSLKGTPVEVSFSGLDAEAPETRTLTHTTDMYYGVKPVDGYIVIQNTSTDGSVLSVTKLRTTNLTGSAESGILPIGETEAVAQMQLFSAACDNREEFLPPVQREELASDKQNAIAKALFGAVRAWL